LGVGIALFVSTLLVTIDRSVRTRIFVGFVAVCSSQFLNDAGLLP
jgi:hypothetical protein